MTGSLPNQQGNELQQIRKEMGFSLGVMAQDINVKKSTLQGYETGRRKCPPDILQAARDSLARDRAFRAGAKARDDAAYPHGIISAPVEAWS